MKEKLLKLINKLDDIESLFYMSISFAGSPQAELIFDVQEFKIWLQAVKLELTDIHKRTNDKFIWDTLNDIKKSFKGWHDREDFNTLKGDLLAIKDNIEAYYPKQKSVIATTHKEVIKMQKKPRIFISHSSIDEEYAKELVALFESMGLNNDQIFCSSVPGYNIPIDEDIFDYLRKQFEEFNLHVIFVLSDNYYKSVVSLNEMGAAWVVKANSTTILLPSFNFEQISGVVSKNKIAIKLGPASDDLKDKLNQLYENITSEFSLVKKKSILWENKRDTFINEINSFIE